MVGYVCQNINTVDQVKSPKYIIKLYHVHIQLVFHVNVKITSCNQFMFTHDELFYHSGEALDKHTHVGIWGPVDTT